MDQFVITVENFPSRSELYEIVDEHLRSSGLSDNYRSKNSDNLLKFIFTEEDSALSVLKRINFQKVENPLYKNTLAKFTIEQRKPFHVPAKSSSQLNVKLHPFKTLSTSLSTKKKNIMTTYGNVDRSYNHVHLLDITSKAGIITTASPYMTEEQYNSSCDIIANLKAKIFKELEEKRIELEEEKRNKKEIETKIRRMIMNFYKTVKTKMSKYIM